VVVLLPAVFLPLCGGCEAPAPAHPAVGRTVGNLPLLSLTDRSRRPPTFAGKVTLLNFWGTWCMPCRRELPGLVRLADRLRSEPIFQLVAVSCGSRGGDDPEKLAAVTNAFLAEQRLALDAWGDPTGRTRLIFSESLGFAVFPTTYLVGPDARIRRVWTGYRPGDEADMARELVAVLKEANALEEPHAGGQADAREQADAVRDAPAVTNPSSGSAAAAAVR
jgi:thiol-disulfide isomerase/thioredoxin